MVPLDRRGSGGLGLTGDPLKGAQLLKDKCWGHGED